MATTNEINTALSQLLVSLRVDDNVSIATEGVVPSTGPLPQQFSLLCEFRESHKTLTDLETRFDLDFAYPDDEYTAALTYSLYDLLSKFRSARELIDLDQPYSEEYLYRLIQNAAITCAIWSEASDNGDLVFDILSDDDDFFPHPTPVSSDDDEPPPLEEVFVKDLTQEGVEPNPGPVVTHVRHNRSSTCVPTKAERKRLKKEQREYVRMLADAAKNHIKTSLLPEAQLGGINIPQPMYTPVPTSLDSPQNECSVCKSTKCDCMVKKLAAVASTTSFLSSLLKIVRTILNWNVPEAQMGLFSMFTADHSDLFTNLNQKIQDIPSREEIATSISDMVKNVLDSECGAIPITVRTMLKALISVVVVFSFYKLGLLVFDVVKVLSTFFLASFEYSKDVIQTLTEWCSPNDVLPAAQVGSFQPEDWLTLLPNLIACFFSLCTVFLVGKIPGKDNTPESWMRKVSMFPRSCVAVSDIFEYLKKNVTVCMSLFKTKVLGYDEEIMNDAIPEIKDWMLLVELYSYEKNMKEACTTRDGKFRLLTLYAKGHNMLLKYNSILSPEYKQAFQRMMVQATKIKAYVESNFPDVKSIRNVPLAVWMVGESQIGKSRLQYLISTELAISAGCDDPKSQIYMRCVEHEFWDGYLNQFVTIFDDFGQMRDTVAQPNIENFEIIRSVGPFPYPLHMADISAKNSTLFTSGVVLCSTNRVDFPIESLTYPDAVWNRLTQSWYVTVNPMYLTPEGKLNIPLIQLNSPLTRNGKRWEVNPYIYRFTKFNARHRVVNDIVHLPSVGWDEFIQVLKDDLASRSQDGSNLDAFLDSYVADKKDIPVAQMDRIEEVEEVFHDVPENLHDLHNVFAQNGTAFPKGPSVGQVFNWVKELDGRVAGATDLDASIYLAMASGELLELTGDPYKVSMLSHTPHYVTARIMEVFLVAYLHAHDSFSSRICKVLQNCSNIFLAKARAISPRVLDFVKCMIAVSAFTLVKVSKFIYDNPFFAGAITLLLISLKNKTTSASPLPPPSPCALTSECESDTRNAQPRLRPTTKPVSVGRIRVAKAEMGQSTGQLDVIAKVRHQQYLIYLDYHASDTKQLLGVVTNIVGQIFLAPRHFYTYAINHPPDEVRLVCLDNVKCEIRHNFDSFFGTIVDIEDPDGHPRDVMVFNVPNSVRRKNILSHFATLEDVAKLHDREFYATLSGLDVEKDSVIKTNTSGKCSVLKTSLTYTLANQNAPPTLVTTTGIAAYTIPTKHGDCGKILSVNSDALSGRVIGIHVSGSKSGFNYAQIIHREELLEAVACFPATAQCASALDYLDPQEGVPLDSGFIHLGKLPHVIPQSSRTTIVKSRMHGQVIPPQTRPAILKPTLINGVLHDPLLEGAKKAGITCGVIPSVILDAAVRDVKINVMTNFREDPPVIRKLTLEEAVAGIPGDELFQPINKTTSPGYPYCLQPRAPGKQKGKTNWLGKYDFELDTPEFEQLKADCEKLESDAANNRPIDVIWIDTLKDEKRPHEKVDAGKTRIISNGPMHYNIVFRMYFMAALAFLRHNRIFNGLAIGLNVWSAEWDFLAKYLLALSEILLDGDFVTLDGTLMCQVMWAIFGILDGMYDDGHTTIRYNLWYAAVYATRCNNGNVYQCTHGLPSGFVATAECNSLYVQILFRCAYLLLARIHAPHLANMKSYNEHCRVIAYGDDNILAVSSVIAEWFNMETIIPIMKTFNMHYTPADKSNVILKTKNIDQISFLKRYFRKVPSVNGFTPIYMCPADLMSRLDMLNWTKDRKLPSNPEEADLVSEVLKELSVHGKVVYDEWSPKVIKSALSSGVTGFRDEGMYTYHHQIITGSSSLPTPRSRDLASSIQSSEVNKRLSTAVSGSGVAI